MATATDATRPDVTMIQSEPYSSSHWLTYCGSLITFKSLKYFSISLKLTPPPSSLYAFYNCSKGAYLCTMAYLEIKLRRAINELRLMKRKLNLQ